LNAIGRTLAHVAQCMYDVDPITVASNVLALANTWSLTCLSLALMKVEAFAVALRQSICHACARPWLRLWFHGGQIKMVAVRRLSCLSILGSPGFSLMSLWLCLLSIVLQDGLVVYVSSSEVLLLDNLHTYCVCWTGAFRRYNVGGNSAPWLCRLRAVRRWNWQLQLFSCGVDRERSGVHSKFLKHRLLTGRDGMM
jgi:hypothetical protein